MLKKLPLFTLLMLLGSACFANITPLVAEKAIPFFIFVNSLDWMHHDIWLNGLLQFGWALTGLSIVMMFSNTLYLFCRKQAFAGEFLQYRVYVVFGISVFLLSSWMLIYSFFPDSRFPEVANSLAFILPKALNVTLFLILFLLGLPALIYEIILTAKAYQQSQASLVKIIYFLYLLLAGFLLLSFIVIAMSGLFNSFSIYSYLLFLTGIIPVIFSIDVFLYLKRMDGASTGFKSAMVVINSFAVVFLLLYVFGVSIFFGLIGFLLQLYLFVELVKVIAPEKIHASVLLSYTFYDLILLVYTVIIIDQLAIPLMFA